MQLLVGCHSLPFLSILFLSFTVWLSYGLPTHLPPDTTSSASEKPISSTESSVPFATFLTTPMVTLNGAEIPMRVVPLEEMESRYFSYLTEGPQTTLTEKETTSVPWVDNILLEEKTAVSTEGILSVEIKSTSVLPSVMKKMSTTSSIETIKTQELTSELEREKEKMSGEELKLVSTKTVSPTPITNGLITSIPETFKSKDLITTAIPNPLINYLHRENTELQTIAPSDPRRVTTMTMTASSHEMPETEQTDKLKKPIASITNFPSTQESVMITREVELITTTNSSIVALSIPSPISNSALVEEATLLSTLVPETPMVGSPVYSDLPTTSTLLKTLGSIISTQETMPNAMMTIETSESASEFQEQMTTTKTEETNLKKITTIPIVTVTAETKKNEEETPISIHNQEISMAGPILSMTGTISVITAKPQIETTAQPLKSTEPLAQNTQNFHITSTGIRSSEISEDTSSTVGVISIQTTESIPPTITLSTTNDKLSPVTTPSTSIPTEGPNASEIKNKEIATTLGEGILVSQPKEPDTSITTTGALPTVQATQNTAASEQVLTRSVVFSESIQGSASTVVKTDPPKVEITSTEIVKPIEVQTTKSSPSESTAAITTNTAGNTGANTEIPVVAEVTTGAETKRSNPTTTEPTASAVPEITITSIAVGVGNRTEIPPNTPSSIIQMPTAMKGYETTVHSVLEILPSRSIADVTKKTLVSTFPQSTTSSSLVPDKVETEETPTATNSTISGLFLTVLQIDTTRSSSDSISENSTDTVSDKPQLQSPTLSSSTTIAANVTTETPSSTAVTNAVPQTTAISPKDVILTNPMVWTENGTQSTLLAGKSEITTPEIAKATRIITSTTKSTITRHLRTQPPVHPDSNENVKSTAQTGHVSTPLSKEKPEITTVDATRVAKDLTAQPEPSTKDILITSSTEIVTVELTQTTQAQQPVVTRRPPDLSKLPVDPNPQRPKDPDPEGMTLATAISMGLILIFLLILLCILAVSLIAGWIHCRGRDSRQPKVSLIRVERGLATEFADSWSKGMSAQAWMTTQSGATAMNPIPPTSPPQSNIQPPPPHHPQNFHCGCKRRGLFRRASQLCLAHGDPSPRHPASAVRAVKIISLSGNSDEEGGNDDVLLTELGRRRASGASEAPGVEEEEGDSRDIGKGRGEWLFIDEA